MVYAECPVILAVLQDLISESIPSQKCHECGSSSQQLQWYGCGHVHGKLAHQ